MGAVGPTTTVLPDVMVLVVLTKTVNVEDAVLFTDAATLETEVEVRGALMVLFW